jgi:hypothetical protein
MTSSRGHITWAMTMKRYQFQLWQSGIEVASVDAPDLASAQREIMHYAMMYAQDGPCEIRGKNMSGFRETFKANTVGVANGEIETKEG